MRRRSIEKLAADMRLKSRAIGASRQVGKTESARAIQVYDAAGVEFFFNGERVDLADHAYVSMSRKPINARKPRYEIAEMSVTQMGVMRDVARVVDEGRATDQGCAACDIGSDGSGALDPSHSFAEGCSRRVP